MTKEEKDFYKQLHHIIRLYHSLYHNNPLYCYTDSDRAWMLDIKRGRTPATLAEAEELRDSYIDKLNQIYDQRKLEYKPQTVDYDLLDSIVMQHIKD